MEFRDWLRGKLTAKGWSQSDLARRSGLSQAAISRILSPVPGVRRRPGADACAMIARAFEIDSSQVFIAAGYQADGTLKSERQATVEYLVRDATPEEYEDIVGYIRYYRDSRDKKKSR